MTLKVRKTIHLEQYFGSWAASAIAKVFSLACLLKLVAISTLTIPIYTLVIIIKSIAMLVAKKETTLAPGNLLAMKRDKKPVLQ